MAKSTKEQDDSAMDEEKEQDESAMDEEQEPVSKSNSADDGEAEEATSMKVDGDEVRLPSSFTLPRPLRAITPLRPILIITTHNSHTYSQRPTGSGRGRQTN